jgi:hypothetical protein
LFQGHKFQSQILFTATLHSNYRDTALKHKSQQKPQEVHALCIKAEKNVNKNDKRVLKYQSKILELDKFLEWWSIMGK